MENNLKKWTFTNWVKELASTNLKSKFKTPVALLHHMYLTVKSYYREVDCSELDHNTLSRCCTGTSFFEGDYSSHPARRSLWGILFKVVEVCYKPFSRMDSRRAVNMLKESVAGLPVQQLWAHWRSGALRCLNWILHHRRAFTGRIFCIFQWPSAVSATATSYTPRISL